MVVRDGGFRAQSRNRGVRFEPEAPEAEVDNFLFYDAQARSRSIGPTAGALPERTVGIEPKPRAFANELRRGTAIAVRPLRSRCSGSEPSAVVRTLLPAFLPVPCAHVGLTGRCPNLRRALPNKGIRTRHRWPGGKSCLRSRILPGQRVQARERGAKRLSAQKHGVSSTLCLEQAKQRGRYTHTHAKALSWARARGTLTTTT